MTIRANGVDVDENRYIDSSIWNRIGSRGFVGGKSVFNLQHRHTLMEITFQANEGIQGNVQEINAMLTARIRQLNNSLLFTEPRAAESNNPAWVVLDVLTGWSIQNKRAPRRNRDECGWLLSDQLDLQSFYDFAQHWQSAG